MLHACFYTICLVFRYTSWNFYAFSGTNLLTRCHSASSLFSAVFVFQKSYTGNILGIGWNKSRTSRILPKLPESRRGDGEGPQGGHTTRGRGLPLARAHLWRGPPGPPLAPPLRLYRPPDGKNLNTRSLFQKHIVIRHRRRPEIRGFKSSSGHPAGEGNRHRRSSSSSCLPPARWVSSLPCTMGL
jgi:hypothetical protein